MRKTLIAAMFMAVVAVVSSCCGCKVSNTKQVATLLNNKWKMTEFKGAEKTSDNDSYTVGFDTKEGRVFGVGDCNRYFGSYTIANKNKLSFSSMGSTRMACPNDSFEQQFLTMLSEVNGYIIDGDKLVFTNDGVAIASFSLIK